MRTATPDDKAKLEALDRLISILRRTDPHGALLTHALVDRTRLIFETDLLDVKDPS